MKTAFVFPGQGSQYVGMGKAFLESVPGTREILGTGEEITGVPLEDLILNGPMQELTRTANLQPCLTAVDIICCMAARAKGLNPDAVAGHSLGEYPALWACGVLSLEDVFRLVLLRGQLMERAGETSPGAMAAIIGLERSRLEELISPLISKGVITLANHNSPEQIVITGEKILVDEACRLAKDQGVRAIPLKVSGAYHSPLMKGPSEEFSRALDDVEFKTPMVPLFSNVSAQAETDPERIRTLMKEQMCSPVRWYEIVINMSEAGVENFVELGPKKVLSNLIRKSVSDRPVKIFQVEDPEGLETCIKELNQ